MKQFLATSIIALALLAPTGARTEERHHHHPEAPVVGAVYTMDNSAAGNNAWALGRRSDGTLTSPVAFPTGGLGTGAGLGNQGAVQLSRDGLWLFVCNAGSDEIAVFSVTQGGLVLTDRIDSAGHQPISLTLHGNLLYVLNAGGNLSGGADNIAGFVFVYGKLIHLPDAEQPLSADSTGPAEISFTRSGDALVVTEKATGNIDTFSVVFGGQLENAKSFLSPVPTPFGFAVGRHDRIFVTEANGGAANPGGSSVSSYEVTEEGDLEAISTSVATHQTAACWLFLTRDERFAYTANTPNNSLSSFRVSPHGELTLLHPHAAMAAGPVDMAASKDGNFLYSLNSGDGTIGAYDINPRTGALNGLGISETLPATVNGRAAR